VQDLSGGNVFYKSEAGEIFHTLSSYGGGGEEVLGIFGILEPCLEAATKPGHIIRCRGEKS
jgi:predicted dithiol-disulfide oxidoreductase (DUF899 family)